MAAADTGELHQGKGRIGSQTSYEPPVSFFSAVLGLAADPAVGTGASFRLEFEAVFAQLVTKTKVRRRVQARNLNRIF